MSYYDRYGWYNEPRPYQGGQQYMAPQQQPQQQQQGGDMNSQLLQQYLSNSGASGGMGGAGMNYTGASGGGGAFNSTWGANAGLTQMPTYSGVAAGELGGGGALSGGGALGGEAAGAGLGYTVGAPAAVMAGYYGLNKELGASSKDAATAVAMPMLDVMTLGLHRDGGGPLGGAFEDVGGWFTDLF